MDLPRSLTRADHVIGVFAREHLSMALSALHRSGFGHHARVFDGARQPLAGQLTRAGLRVVDPANFEQDDLMIVVTAPGRAPIVAEMFHETGAERVMYAERASADRIPNAEPVFLPKIDNAAGEIADG